MVEEVCAMVNCYKGKRLLSRHSEAVIVVVEYGDADAYTNPDPRAFADAECRWGAERSR